MEDITVKQLKEIIKELPDDMVVGTYRRIDGPSLVACGFKQIEQNKLFNILLLT